MARPGSVPSTPVALPGGFTWLQRESPDSRRFARWRAALEAVVPASAAREQRLNAELARHQEAYGACRDDAARKAELARHKRAASRLGDEGPLRRAAANERIALLAAYDAGWDVKGADGQVVPPPAKLSLRGWNAVPRVVIEALLAHLDAEAAKEIGRFNAQAAQQQQEAA